MNIRSIIVTFLCLYMMYFEIIFRCSVVVSVVLVIHSDIESIVRLVYIVIQTLSSAYNYLCRHQSSVDARIPLYI